MIFIGLAKVKGKPTKQNTAEFTKMLELLLLLAAFFANSGLKVPSAEGITTPSISI